MAGDFGSLHQKDSGQNSIIPPSDKVRQLSRIAILLCRADDDEIRAAIMSALGAAISSTEIREVIHTSYLFDGYPTALEGFRILAEVDPSQSPPHSEFHYSPSNIELWTTRGEQLCKTIYGAQYDSLMQRVTEISPELHKAMIVEGYGKVLSRDSLDVLVRELCVIAILAYKNRPRQLLSHALGALRLGARTEHFDILLETLTEYVPETQLSQSRSVIISALSKTIAS